MDFTKSFTKIAPNRLRSQLILCITVIIVVSISLFVVDLVSRQKKFYLKLNHDRGISLSENLASIGSVHVVSYELEGLQKLVSNYKKMPGLEYAMITTPDGIVLAHTNNKYLGLKPVDAISTSLKPVNMTQILLADNYIFDVASPIMNHDEIVGWARIGLSQSYLTANLIEIKKKGLLYILLSLIMGIVFAIIIAGRLSGGLQKLVTVAHKIKEGNRDLRASPSNSVEVTQLGTAINRMLDEISTNEKLLNLVLENMPVGVVILDAAGKVLSLNPAAKEIWKGAKYVGMDEYKVYRAWFPDGKEIESHEWGVAIALAENRAVLNQELEIEAFDGTRKNILNSGLPLHDTNDKIIGAIAINIDITERKLAERKLRQSEEKNRALVENISDTIVLLNDKAQIIYQSPGFFRTSGFSLEDLKDKTVFDQIHPENRSYARDLFKKVMANPGVPYKTEYRTLHKNGHYFWAEGSVMNLLNNESVKALVINYRDISDRRNLELEREKNLTELLQRNRSLEQFSYIVSHNVREPVAAIIGLSDVLQNTYLTWKGKKEFIQGIDISAQKLDGVLRDLNAILNVRDNIHEEKEIVDLVEMVAEINISLNRLIVNEKVQFICNFDTNKIITIKTYLYSIFYNLISNSIKYRQPKINPIIEITCETKGEKTILRFKDNGLGIDLQKKGKDVFGLYKRFHAHTKGKGMGLFMVKTHVEALGGTISIRSQENIGTEFTIELEN